MIGGNIMAKLEKELEGNFEEILQIQFIPSVLRKSVSFVSANQNAAVLSPLVIQ